MLQVKERCCCICRVGCQVAAWFLLSPALQSKPCYQHLFADHLRCVFSAAMVAASEAAVRLAPSQAAGMPLAENGNTWTPEVSFGFTAGCIELNTAMCRLGSVSLQQGQYSPEMAQLLPRNTISSH
jgi:hypothetical protein